MSYHLHKARANEVIKDSLKIENLEKRVLYLIKAKGAFTSENTGHEVGLIASIYDSAIEETKFLIQLSPSNTPEDKNEIQKIVHFKPPKVTAGKLKTELQAIFDELPALIDYCERNGQRLAAQIIEEIEDEINLTPERKEQVIISNRDKYAEWYKKLISSGLRLKATDKEEILQLIGLQMFATGTWELPMPQNCSFSSIKPDPKGYFHTMLAPIFNSYAIIQACNKLLNPPKTKTPETAEATETTEQKLKRLLEPNRGAFDNSGHIDFIVKALAECFEDKEYSNKPIRATAIYESLEKFYEPFVNVWKNIGLTPKKIGEVLNRHIFMHNGKREEISPGTVRKHIYIIGKKLATVTDRNKP